MGHRVPNPYYSTSGTSQIQIIDIWDTESVGLLDICIFRVQIQITRHLGRPSHITRHLGHRVKYRLPTSRTPNPNQITRHLGHRVKPLITRHLGHRVQIQIATSRTPRISPSIRKRRPERMIFLAPRRI
ncbi:hypothetical protein AVEN_36997-1 [Araneus ventricosus]|uniref:Uncharacterized protein n=1 Tax=Araneus ventricosus TaxID=182803 RepID=A0A4Y2KVW8_ARAVE|nr:hypothetical protein AVEN_36997-1 [Araneus ventricosus]